MTAVATGFVDKIPQQDSAPGTSRADATSASTAGFTDLINLLLAPLTSASSEDLNEDGGAADMESQAELTPPAPLGVRSPHEIAGALIRAMSGRAIAATNAFSDAPANKSTETKMDRKQREAVSLLTSAQPPVPQLVSPVQLASVSSSQARSVIQPGATVEMAKKSISSAPLAFSLKLTHNESAKIDSSAAQDSNQATGGDAQNAPPSGSHEPKPTTAEPATHEPQDFKPTTASESALQSRASDVAAPLGANASNAIGGSMPAIPSVVSPVTAPLPVRAAAVPTAMPVASSAQALRSSAEAEPAPLARSAAAQEISVRIARPEAAAVDVHLIERAGQVHVAVRTPDAGLQTSLRQDLGTLVNSLERAGFRTETALPHGAMVAESSGQTSQNSSQDKQEPNGGWSGTGGGNPGRNSGGDRQQQQQERREPQDWTDTMEGAQ